MIFLKMQIYRMFACESLMETDQNAYTMESTGIPLEYVEFELKHAKVGNNVKLFQ